jgi:hypothetical protein
MMKMIAFATLAVVLSAGSALAVSAAEKAALAACKGDIAQFCGNVPPGGGKIKACLKQHIEEVSPGCKDAAYKAWLTK